MSPLRAHRSPRGFSSFAGCQNSAEPSEGRGAWACGSPRPRGTSPPSRVGAPLAGSRGNWGCCPTEQVWRRAAGGGGAGASRRLVAAPAPRPRAPRSPGEVASWRAGCGAAGPRGRDPQQGSPRPQWPEGLPGALAGPRRHPPSPGSSGSLLPATCFSASPASTARSATSASRAGRPSRPPAGPPARRPRPPSFVVR